MNRPGRASRLREWLFRVSVILKGLDGLLEAMAGVALLLIKPEVILRTIAMLTQDELADDPRDFFARHLQGFVEDFSVGTQHFVAFYLLIHGVVKVLLVGALLGQRVRLYPLAMAVFGALIAYQFYRFSYTHAIGLIVLSGFDMMMIWLIWLEYRALRWSSVAA